jgi:CubicO group peptidase (beta-lactamase class C family)
MPQYRPFANDDARKAKLTLADLMSMRSGLARDDNDPDSPGGEDRMQRQKDQPDWYRYRLDLPMLKEPGGRDAVYCSADLNLVGGVAETIAQTWNGDLFERHVAEPLGFATYHLNLMPTGSGYTGGGVYLRPRDALKLGQLYLAGGLWNGTRVVSRDWVDRRGLRDVPATGRRRRRQPPVRLRLARPPFRRRWPHLSGVRRRGERRSVRDGVSRTRHGRRRQRREVRLIRLVPVGTSVGHQILHSRRRPSTGRSSLTGYLGCCAFSFTRAS